MSYSTSSPSFDVRKQKKVLVIMVTYSTVYAATAALFVTIILVVRIKADPNRSESGATSISPPSEDISPASSIIVDIEPLPEKIFHQRIPSILSPEIFSQLDPLPIILAKVTNNRYNGDSDDIDFIRRDLNVLSHNVDYYLSQRKFPKLYVRYAKLLSSLLVCLLRLQKVSTSIGKIHQKYSAQSEYPPAPSDISTPELLALFSKDIFSDPDIPSILLKKLLQIPEDRIEEVTADLKKLLKNPNNVELVYHEYMTSLRTFLQYASCLSGLRRANASIPHRISNY